MVHIGNEIKKKFKQAGITVKSFSDKLHTTRENVYGIFKRDTIDTGLLYKISIVLDYNFFDFYNKTLRKKDDCEEKITQINKELLSQLKENDILKELVDSQRKNIELLEKKRKKQGN